MPIYAYRCSSCGHAKDVLQKLSDPVVTLCPACGASTFVKQVTAAGFQLKGSGWYVTDFRGDNKPKPGASDGGDAAKTGTDKNEPAKTDAAGAAAPATPASTSAPAPAPAAATPPSSPASGSK